MLLSDKDLPLLPPHPFIISDYFKVLLLKNCQGEKKRFGGEYFKKDYDANDSAALLWRSLSQTDSRIWAPSEFGDIWWSVDQGEEQPAHHRGPLARGYSDLLRSCLGLHEWLAEESLAKSFPFLLLFLFSFGSMKILPNHTSHIIRIDEEKN